MATGVVSTPVASQPRIDNPRYGLRNAHRISNGGDDLDGSSRRTPNDKSVTRFQKLLDHPGLVGNSLVWPLAHAGLGRAYDMQRDTEVKLPTKTLSLSGKTDPDIPILKQVKAEYAKLQ